MNEFMTEQEQVEQLKAWIKQYGLTILAGVVLAFILSTAWNTWQRHQQAVLMRASVIFDSLLESRTSGSLPLTTTKAEELVKDYPNTPYASLAAMMLARDAIAHKDFSAAITQLNWVIKNSKDISLQQIALTRIARAYLANNEPQKALDTLTHISQPSFAGYAAEIKGDTLLHMNEFAKAKEAYTIALQTLPSDEFSERSLVQMKLNNMALPS